MARRTTVVLSSEDALALQRASHAEGRSQSELIRKGIRAVTAAYRRRSRPLTRWLKLTKAERDEVAREAASDFDS